MTGCLLSSHKTAILGISSRQQELVRCIPLTRSLIDSPAGPANNRRAGKLKAIFEQKGVFLTFCEFECPARWPFEVRRKGGS